MVIKMQKSIWLKDIKTLQTNELKKYFKTDVLIIGAGITGISTAYFLKDSNLKISVIDRSKVGFGVSALTTGKITYLQDNIYHKLEKTLGIDISKKYLKSQQEACEILKKIIIKKKIECDYKKNDSIIFATDDISKNKLLKEKETLEKIGVDIKEIKKLPNNYPCNYGIKINDSAVFNSVKYIRSLAGICLKKGINIYEDTCALTVDKDENFYIIKTNKNTIKAKYVVIASHYPLFVIPGLIPFRTYLEKSHLVACEVDETKEFNAITNNKPTITMRYHKDEKKYFIFGSETDNMSGNINYNKEQEKVENKFHKHFKNKIIYEWSICDLTTNDNLPFIGSINSKNPNLFIATGYNKWGMTNGTIAAKLISDLILKKQNKYKELFKPYRKTNITKIKNEFVYLFNTSKIFLKTKINKNKSFYKDNVKIVNENGQSVGIYIDENKKEHKVHNLCPHMKCSLVFNYMEKCWDCPCHSSKFDIDGNCIKGPSVYSIKLKKGD